MESNYMEDVTDNDIRDYERRKLREVIKSILDDEILKSINKRCSEIESQLRANQIGLQNVYDQFKRIKGLGDFENLEGRVNKMLNEINDSQIKSLKIYNLLNKEVTLESVLLEIVVMIEEKYGR